MHIVSGKINLCLTEKCPTFFVTDSRSYCGGLA